MAIIYSSSITIHILVTHGNIETAINHAQTTMPDLKGS